jgi:hypothetical protein
MQTPARLNPLETTKVDSAKTGDQKGVIANTFKHTKECETKASE